MKTLLAWTPNFNLMNFSYAFANTEQTIIVRSHDDGTTCSFPTDPDNRDYAEFLASGAKAAPYVAPPEPEPLTKEEKVNHLLSDYGLTRTELLEVLS